MRPDRAIVKKAIADADNNLSRAAALLGCSRTALYTWIYQLGLERYAGVRIDTRDGLDRHDRKDTDANKTQEQIKRVLTHGPAAPPILRAVQTAPISDLPVQATVKLPESVWKRVKIAAIHEGATLSDFVRKALESALGDQVPAKRRASKKDAE